MPKKLKSTAAFAALALILVLSLAGCSVEKLALKKVAGMLTGPSGADVFSSDNDPDFVGQALPFAIKLPESLLGSLPDHPRLRRRDERLSPGPGQEPLPARPRHPLRRAGEEEPLDPPAAHGQAVQRGPGPLRPERRGPALLDRARLAGRLRRQPL